jgi:cell division septum initiation protein DivIVA
MSNPNNNMNAYKQALQINRDLKKENDALKEQIRELLEILGVDFKEEEKEIIYDDWLEEYNKEYKDE